MTKRPVQIDDLLRLRLPMSIQQSPDGERVVWVERKVDTKTQKSRSRLWGWRPGDTAPLKMTEGGAVDESQPRISPDSKRVAYLRKPIGAKRAATELCVVELETGKIRPLLSAEGDFGAPSWTADSSSLVIAFRHADPIPEGEDAPLSIRVDRVFYKLDGAGYLPQDRFRLYTVDLASPSLEPLAHHIGDWDDTEPACSPAGAEVAFVSNRRDGRELNQDNADVWVVSRDGGEPRQCTRREGWLSTPSWAPDSSWIAAFGCFGPPSTMLMRANVDLISIDPAGSRDEVSLTGTLDRCAMNLTIDDIWGLDEWLQRPGFSTAGDRVLVPISDRGTTTLTSFPVSSPTELGEPSKLFDGAIAVSHACGGDKVVAITTSPTRPGVIVRAGLDGSEAVDIAWPLEPYVNEVAIAEPVELEVTSADGTAIQAWMLLPDPEIHGDGPYPMLLDIHGGPVVQFGTGFFHELQTFVARGYAVLIANPRGSQGYGIDFTSCIARDWSGLPMQDLMAAVDAAIERFDIDSDRLGVVGGSYGGYMTNWIVGHTDRFACACTQRTVSMMEPLIWSDFGWAWGHELGSWPWEDPEHYTQQSPITHAADMNTPLLILQGLDDHRTPADQGERLFVTLRVLGKPVEMVLFPGAGHDLSRSGPPRQRVERLRVIHEWFDRHLSPGRAESAP